MKNKNICVDFVSHLESPDMQLKQTKIYSTATLLTDKQNLWPTSLRVTGCKPWAESKFINPLALVLWLHIEIMSLAPFRLDYL